MLFAGLIPWVRISNDSQKKKHDIYMNQVQVLELLQHIDTAAAKLSIGHNMT